MEELIAAIGRGTQVAVATRAFVARAKVIYVTETAPDSRYAKIFFDDHRVLVVSPGDEIIYFGRDIGSIGVDPPFDKRISYEGNDYRLVSEDYQIPVELSFGPPLTTEGEVRFWDYESLGDRLDIISIGIVQRTKERADIVARIIELSDIAVLK